ncbi:MAG: DUF87 domain-containing protein, partial [Chlamydiia bacterium]|nr:DUF87 domain-containing protein [Chlamydiia bacterium]
MEKFYLGSDTRLDPKDLTTHAVCLGMTGSGKTGLCIALLEEAALQGIPALIIDPKGDIGNLLLAFPDFAAKNFQPWVEPPTLEKGAETAKLWKEGLASWGIESARVKKFKEAVDIAIYTPASHAGLQISILNS